jgi:hypothetical protein
MPFTNASTGTTVRSTCTCEGNARNADLKSASLLECVLNVIHQNFEISEHFLNNFMKFLKSIWLDSGVVPEYQCAVKREAKKAQKEKDKPNSTTQSPTPPKIESKVLLKTLLSKFELLWSFCQNFDYILFEK